MANYKEIIPFILKAEGGWVNDPSDSGGETNKGITYSTWKSFYGDTHERFMKMFQDDWNQIFKTLYWDKIKGDDINSQRLANILVDWVWGSGFAYPPAHLQIILNEMGNNLTVDGSIGKMTIQALNKVNEQKLWDRLVKDRFDFLDDIVKKNPKNQKFLQGWKNRMNNLIKFCS